MQSNLVQIMSDRGMTIRALVEKTGISSATIQKARDNRIEFCRLGTLIKISEALDVALQDIIIEGSNRLPEAHFKLGLRNPELKDPKV